MSLTNIISSRCVSRPADAGVVYLRGSPSWIQTRQQNARLGAASLRRIRRHPLGLGQSPEIANKNQTEIRAFLPTHSHTHAQRTSPRCISPACINKRITPPCLALVRGAFSSLSVTPDTQPRCSLTPVVSPDSLVSDKARSLGTYRPFLIPH